MTLPQIRISDELRAEIEDLYRRVDAEIARIGVVCWLRGKCCDFEHNEHRLWASSVEIAYVDEKHPEPFAPGSVLCPFWKDGLCTERERRPLGCRTYFCDPAHREATESAYERFHAEFRALADRFDVPYTYRDFVAALRTVR
jgi:hypothetical protein